MLLSTAYLKLHLYFVQTNLLPTLQPQHQVSSRLLLDVVVGERSAVFQLLASENQALLVRRIASLS